MDSCIQSLSPSVKVIFYFKIVPCGLLKAKNTPICPSNSFASASIPIADSTTPLVALL